MEKPIYSLGTIVYLAEGNKKIMIIGRGVVYRDDVEEKDMFVDYMGCAYPEGIDPSDTIFFNHENIDKVIFEGYDDEDDEARFKELYEKWEKTVEVPRKIIG